MNVEPSKSVGVFSVTVHTACASIFFIFADTVRCSPSSLTHCTVCFQHDLGSTFW